MAVKSTPVEKLRNVGPTIARRLREIDIHTDSDLRSVGAVTAYQRICAKYPGKTIPVCYYLYSLEGALRDQHWDALRPKLKQDLLSQVSPNTYEALSSQEPRFSSTLKKRASQRRDVSDR